MIIDKILNQEITSIELVDDDRLIINKCVQFRDNGQSCCESRYLDTDENLSYFIGSVFSSFDITDGPSTEEDYDTHEIHFLNIRTTRGTMVFKSHNKHNGYYGGISISIEEVSL